MPPHPQGAYAPPPPPAPYVNSKFGDDVQVDTFPSTGVVVPTDAAHRSHPPHMTDYMKKHRLDVRKPTGIHTLDDGMQSTFVWRNISFTVKTKNGPRKILDNVSGAVRPGELLAIMGPSGSGKTTMLDFLADRLTGDITGEVLVNGRPRDGSFKRLASYVPQEEFFFGSLTVRETLMFSARLNLPDSLSAEEKRKRVDAVVQALGLGVCADTKIGSPFFRGISGGQKRRLSMGIEIITDPSIILLDEPTSGLDSAAAAAVVEGMRHLAADGRTVLCTIHQPESEVFNMFDRVLILSTGKMIYQGPTQELVSYMDRVMREPCPSFVNPSDHALRLVNIDFLEPQDLEQGRQRIASYVQAFQTSSQYQDLMATVDRVKAETHGGAAQTKISTYRTGVFTQTAVLTHRNILNNMRNPAIFWIRLAMYLMLSILVGTCFVNVGVEDRAVQNRASVMWYINSFFVFMSVSAIPAFIEERNVFMKERANGAYRLSAYWLANFLASAPFVFLIAIVSSGIYYPIIKLREDGSAYGFHLLIIWTSLMCAEAMTLVMSAIVPIFMVALAGGAFLFGYMMTVMGYFIQPVDLPKFWLYLGYYWAAHTYAWAAFMKNDFSGLVFNTRRYCNSSLPALTFNGTLPTDLASPNAGACILWNFSSNSTAPLTLASPGSAALNYWNMMTHDKWYDFLILAGMLLFYRVCFLVLLKFRHTGKK
eukprot:tig00000254_g22534.t1